jgi:hypothetical protein
MTKDDRLFLSNFKKHVKFFLKKKHFTKKQILHNLNVPECPFRLEDYNPILRTYYVGIGKGKMVHRDKADPTFQWNMYYDWGDLTKEMKAIVKSVRV